MRMKSLKGSSNREFGPKFNENRTALSRQISKIIINNYGREKTLKHIKDGALKAKMP